MARIRVLIVHCTAAIIFVTSGIARAETEADTIKILRAQLQANQQAVVAENLFLSEEESARFWPLYREYKSERATLEDRRLSLLIDFRDKFDTLTDEQSIQVLTSYLKYEGGLLKLQKKYSKKFRKAISGKNTLRYFQIENQIDSIIDFELSQLMPLAE